jgi:hypothetical protein
MTRARPSSHFRSAPKRVRTQPKTRGRQTGAAPREPLNLTNHTGLDSSAFGMWLSTACLTPCCRRQPSFLA